MRARIPVVPFRWLLDPRWRVPQHLLSEPRPDAVHEHNPRSLMTLCGRQIRLKPIGGVRPRVLLSPSPERPECPECLRRMERARRAAGLGA